MSNPWEIYDLLIARANEKASSVTLREIILGLTWTVCHSNVTQGDCMGLAMSPNQYTRTLPWSGTLIHKPINEITTWVKNWNSFESAIGLAAINSIINSGSCELTNDSVPLTASETHNLAVFEYFLPRLKNKKVVVIGRYPGLEKLESSLDLAVLERNPVQGDFPDPACEYVLPDADWVFLTANSIANKTFPRLAELSRNAVTVLMGPSVPWLRDWVDYGVDFLAGIRVSDPDLLRTTVAEGGGVRIFDKAVQYHVLDLGQHKMRCLKTNIADLVLERNQLKAEMESWYVQNSGIRPSRFPKWAMLEKIDQQLSLLDLRYKRQWDARNSI